MKVRIKIYDLSCYGQLDQGLIAILDYDVKEITKKAEKIIQEILDEPVDLTDKIYNINQVMHEMGASDVFYDKIYTNIRDKRRK